MADISLADSPEFSELTTAMARFLGRIPFREITQIDGITPQAFAKRAEAAKARAEAGEKIDMKELSPLFEAIGMERAGFETAAKTIHKAARAVLEAAPGFERLSPDVRKATVTKALGAQDSAIRFVQEASGVSPQGAQLAFIGGQGGGDILDDLGVDEGINECEIACSLAAGIAFGNALEASINRAVGCAGISALSIIGAIICLIVVAALYILAGKVAEEAYVNCIAAC